MFKTPNGSYAILEKFYNHPKLKNQVSLFFNFIYLNWFLFTCMRVTVSASMCYGGWVPSRGKVWRICPLALCSTIFFREISSAVEQVQYNSDNIFQYFFCRSKDLEIKNWRLHSHVCHLYLKCDVLSSFMSASRCKINYPHRKNPLRS